MLQEIGFNNGEPITEEFFIKNISGKHNDELSNLLLPDWDLQRAQQFMEDKEAMFRRLAAEKLKPLNGLQKLCKWIEDRGLKRAAVTNAPRSNVELMLSQLDLNDFFEAVILASECERAKPFPDPYLKGLQALQASPRHTFVFEDYISEILFPEGFGFWNKGQCGCWNARNPEAMLKDAGAAFVIKDFDDTKLWEALEELEISVEEAKLTA
ncbi:hypothetical protein Leryth_014171 [Lithospermum erythrorhizon]|nr:hypothetical protein Leryth_014171 [Lithospermum erythrorhizon]